MNIYIAARAKNRTGEVMEIQKNLRTLGHNITYDWAESNTSIKKPYRVGANRQSNSTVIPRMLNAAAEADVFILLDEPGLRGAYVEMGAFLQRAFESPQSQQMFIVGPDSVEREHIFESPAFVKFVDSIEDVYNALSE